MTTTATTPKTSIHSFNVTVPHRGEVESFDVDFPADDDGDTHSATGWDFQVTLLATIDNEQDPDESDEKIYRECEWQHVAETSLAAAFDSIIQELERAAESKDYRHAVGSYIIHDVRRTI